MPRVYNSHSAEQYDLTKSEDIHKLEKNHPGVDTLQGSYFSTRDGHLLYNVGESRFESSGLPGGDFFTNRGSIELIDRDNKNKYSKDNYELYKDDPGFLKGWRKIKISTDGWFENYPLDKIDFYLRIEAEKNKLYIKDNNEEWNAEDGKIVIYEKKLANAKEFESNLKLNHYGYLYFEDILFTINEIGDFPLFPKEDYYSYKIFQYNPKYRKVKYSIIIKSTGENWIDDKKPIYLSLGYYRNDIAELEVHSVNDYVNFLPKRGDDGYNNIYLWRHFEFHITGVTEEEIKDIVVQTTVELNHSKGKIIKTYDFTLDKNKFPDDISINYDEQTKFAKVKLYRNTFESKIYDHLDKETKTWVFTPMYNNNDPLKLSLNYGDWIPFFDHDSDSNLTGRIKYEMKRIKGNRFYYRIPKLNEQDEAKLWFDFTLENTSRVKELNGLFLKRVWLSNNDTVWSKDIYKKPYEKVKMYGAIYNFPTLIDPEEVEFIFSARHKRRDNGEWVEVDYPCEKLIYDNVYLHNGGHKNRDRWMRDARIYEKIDFHFEITDSKGYPLPNDEVNYVRVRLNEYSEGEYGFKFKLKDKYRYRTEFLPNYGTGWFRRYTAEFNENCTSPFIWCFKPYEDHSYYGKYGYFGYSGNIYYDVTRQVPTSFIRSIYSDQSFILKWNHVYRDKNQKLSINVKVEQINKTGDQWVTLQEYDLLDLFKHDFFKSSVIKSNYKDEEYSKKFNFDYISSSKDQSAAIKYNTRLQYKKNMGQYWDVILPFPVFYQQERDENYEVTNSWNPEIYKVEHSWLYRDYLPGTTRGIRKDLGNRLRFVIESYSIGKNGEYKDQRFQTFKPWINEFELRDIPNIQVIQQGREENWEWYESTNANKVQIVLNFPDHQQILEQLESITYVADKDKTKLLTNPEYKVTEEDYIGKTNKFYHRRKINKYHQSGDHHWYFRIEDQSSSPKNGKDKYLPMPISDYFLDNNVKIVSDKDRERNDKMFQGLIPVWKSGTSEEVKNIFLQLYPDGYFPLRDFKFSKRSEV